MIAQGIILSISQDGTTYEPIGCIQSFSLEQPERAEIDVTCLTSTSKEYKFGLRDSGTLSIDLQYEPQSAGQLLLESSYASDDSYSFKIEYTDAPAGGTPTTKEFDGFVTSISESGATDDLVTESATIRLTGDITTTPPAPAP
jgi:hypothetical protein